MSRMTIWEQRGWVKPPAEWEAAEKKDRFGLLGVGVADGTVWKLSPIIGMPKTKLGPLEGARADITDPSTRRSIGREILAWSPTSLVFTNKITETVVAVTLANGQQLTHKYEGMSAAKSALEEVIAFNQLAGSEKSA